MGKAMLTTLQAYLIVALWVVGGGSIMLAVFLITIMLLISIIIINILTAGKTLRIIAL